MFLVFLLQGFLSALIGLTAMPLPFCSNRKSSANAQELWFQSLNRMGLKPPLTENTPLLTNSSISMFGIETEFKRVLPKRCRSAPASHT